jgi:hypothetical protein
MWTGKANWGIWLINLWHISSLFPFIEIPLRLAICFASIQVTDFLF